MQLFKLTFYMDQGRKTRVYRLTFILMMCINKHLRMSDHHELDFGEI